MKSLYTSYRNFIIVPVGFLLMLSLTTCIKDEIDMSKVSNTVDWNPKWGVPIAYGNLSLRDLIDAVDSGGIIKEDPSGLLYLTYRNRILSKTIDSVFTIPNQQYQEIFNGSDLPGFPVDSLIYRRNNNYTFQFNKGEEVDSAYFKSGTLVFSVQSEFYHKGRITITMPTLTHNGIPLQFTIPIDVGDGTFSDSITRNISGYKLTLNSGNQLPFTYEVAFGDPTQPTLSTQKMTVNINVRQPLLRSFFGYIDVYKIIDNLSGQIKIDIFNTVLSSDIQFRDPRLKILYSNSFGIPLSIQLSNLRATSDSKGSVNLTLNSPSLNPILVACPNITQIGKRVYDSIPINNSNSNIADAINIAPQFFYYTLDATTNPAGKTFNFALDTSKLDVDMEVELPIDIKASNYQMSDTIDFDLTGIVSDYSIVNKMAINATFTNGIPFDLSLQLFLAKENYVIVDTLFTAAQQPIIQSGEVDSNGKVVKPTTKPIQVIYDSNNAKRLENVKYAIIRGNVTTAGNGQTYVKFYSNYILDVALGVQVDLKIRSLDQL